MTRKTPSDFRTEQAAASSFEQLSSTTCGYAKLIAWPGADSALEAIRRDCPDADLMDLLVLEVSDILAHEGPAHPAAEPQEISPAPGGLEPGRSQAEPANLDPAQNPDYPWLTAVPGVLSLVQPHADEFIKDDAFWELLDSFEQGAAPGPKKT